MRLSIEPELIIRARSGVLSPEQIFHNQVLHRTFLEAASLAALAVVAYEHVLTFADEVNHIWMPPQSLVTISFLILRYFTVVGRIFDLFLYFFRGWTRASCDVVYKNLMPSLPIVISIFLAHIIMIFRVCALYRVKNGVRFGLMALLLVEILIMVLPMYLLRDTFHPNKATPQTPDDNHPVVDCISGSKNHDKAFVLFWTSPLLIDTVLFVLTIWKSRRYAQSMRCFPLLRVLVRDGVLYYVVIGCTHLLNLVIFMLAPEDLRPIVAGFSQAMTTIIISRLVLNLRISNSCHSTDCDESENTSPFGLGPLTTLSPESLAPTSTTLGVDHHTNRSACQDSPPSYPVNPIPVKTSE